ncbi:MAG: DEAD/DEAH box helicase [Phycisphaerales bacterium]|nr:DEAD/DEAH box helicase [Phycisphaerales bacterium]
MTTNETPSGSMAGRSQDIFAADQTFASLGLSEPILRALSERGFVHPTRIQADLIPIVLAGRDCLGQAKTGTGKTAAFGLPALQLIEPSAALSVLILVPTRELAIQVAKEIHDFARHTGHHVVPIYGGQPIPTQLQKLHRNPAIVVGTPGRVMDLHQRGELSYSNVRFAVLDEVDRMLDIGFREDIRKILGSMKQHPQTVFVSATISPDIEKLARQYLRDPEKIVATAKSLTVSQVRQTYFAVEHWDKRRLLLHLLRKEDPALTLVFCRMKRTVDDVTEFLGKNGIDAHQMHGDMYQTKRDKVMSKLREGTLSVLVASDLASRGLDVDDISHVVNYDLPEDPEVYVHRIGRTARAGRDGVAWTFVCPDQGELLTAIESLANIEIPVATYDDFVPGSVPSDIHARRELEQVRRQASMESKSRDPLANKPDATDLTRFPGGLVPTQAPPNRFGGRLTTRRKR